VLERAGFAPADMKRLDQLPPAAHHLAVLRNVGGCPVATIKFQGRIYWVPLPSQGTLQALPAQGQRIVRARPDAPTAP
jgi:hypothetical protein